MKRADLVLAAGILAALAAAFALARGEHRSSCSPSVLPHCAGTAR